MFNRNLTDKKKGFTLVEIIIAMAIASLVVASAGPLLIFSNRIFNRSSAQYDVQSNNRLAADYIQKQIKYATDIYLADAVDIDYNTPKLGDIELNQPEILVYEGNSLIHKKWEDGQYKVIFKTPYISNLSFSLSGNEIEIVLNSEDHKYDLKSNLVLPNRLNTGEPSTGNNIYFTRDMGSAGLTTGLVTITLSLEDGTVIGKITGTVGSPVVLPEGLPSPVKPGYIFAGWDGLPSTMPSYDLVLRPKWISTLALNSPNLNPQKDKPFSYIPSGSGGVAPYVYKIEHSGWQTPIDTDGNTYFNAVVPKKAGDKAYLTITVSDSSNTGNTKIFNYTITAK